MSEQRIPYITATAPHIISREESVTLVTTKRRATCHYKLSELSNKHRRGDVARYAIVDLETWEIGSIIAFET